MLDLTPLRCILSKFDVMSMIQSGGLATNYPED